MPEKTNNFSAALARVRAEMNRIVGLAHTPEYGFVMAWAWWKCWKDIEFLIFPSPAMTKPQVDDWAERIEMTVDGVEALEGRRIIASALLEAALQGRLEMAAEMSQAHIDVGNLPEKGEGKEGKDG